MGQELLTNRILAAIEVRDEGLLQPALVGPDAGIRAAAERAGVLLDGIAIEPTSRSHAAVARAFELAVAGRVAALVKGSFHSDELLAPSSLRVAASPRNPASAMSMR